MTINIITPILQKKTTGKIKRLTYSTSISSRDKGRNQDFQPRHAGATSQQVVLVVFLINLYCCISHQYNVWTSQVHDLSTKSSDFSGVSLLTNSITISSLTQSPNLTVI